MAATAQAIQPPSRALLLLEGRALWELGAFAATLPLLGMAPRGDGHTVMVLPGLIASDRSTVPLRRFLNNQGYAAQGWGMGRNLGPRPGVQRQMLLNLRDLYRASGRKVSLVGWSLGGIFARELAKQAPDMVRLVVTLGSPFAGHPRSTNAWRVYEVASGETVNDHDDTFMDQLRPPPPVPTTAIYSRSDGVAAWQGCLERPAPQAENIEVPGSHCGLGHNPAAVYAVADRLAQPENDWRPFERTGWKCLVYPDPTRPG
ncbi:MAG TPA: alpha/beta hydrolase [Vineibacter sp.]|nr:alpha/beta hydrolase [Vineibacter sp.]